LNTFTTQQQIFAGSKANLLMYLQWHIRLVTAISTQLQTILSS